MRRNAGVYGLRFWRRKTFTLPAAHGFRIVSHRFDPTALFGLVYAENSHVV